MTDRNAARSATEKMYYAMNKMHCGKFYERSLVAMVKLVGDGGLTVPKAYTVLKIRPRLFQLWTTETFGIQPAALIKKLLDKKPVQTLKHFEVAHYVQFTPEIVRKVIPSTLHEVTEVNKNQRYLYGALRADGTGMVLLPTNKFGYFNYAVKDPSDFIELNSAHPDVVKELDARNLTSLLALITE